MLSDLVTINGKVYPSGYIPGSHWAVDEAWRILDMIGDGVIPDEVRIFLAGAITALLIKEREKKQIDTPD